MPWLLKAETDQHRGFSGRIGYFPVNKGVAQVDSLLERRFLMKRGFRDITPDDLVEETLAEPKKSFFVIRTGAAGDLLMVTPFLRELRRRWPEIKITLATTNSRTYHDIFDNNPDAPDELHTGLPVDYLLEAKQYDDSVDLTHSIEMNADAEYENAYEIPFRICRMPVPKDLKPSYEATPPERTRAKLELEAAGFDLGRPIVALHLKASSRNRTYGSDPSQHLVNLLVAGGAQCVLLGDPRFANYTKAPAWCIGPDKLPFRISIAILTHCQLAVTVDSAFLHLAQALDVPQVAMFGSFEASLRMKHFKNCLALQSPRRCSPCHLHVDVCNRMEEEGYSNNLDATPCMGLLPAPLVADTALKMLAPGATVETGIFNQTKRPEGAPRRCPFCDGEPEKPAGFKAGVSYKVCRSCESVVSINPPDETKTYADYALIQKAARRDMETTDAAKTVSDTLLGALHRPGNLLEIGAGAGFFLVKYIRLGWKVTGVDCSSFLVDHGRERLGLQTLHHADMEVEEFEGDVKYEAVLLNEVMEKTKNPEVVIRKAASVLSEEGVLAVLGASADAMKIHGYVQSPWLVTYYPGQTRQVSSRAGLNKTMQRLGFEEIGYRQGNQSETFLALFKKVGALPSDRVNLVPENAWPQSSKR